MRKLSHFVTDRAGNVAITFSLAAIPAMMLIGGGVDYANMVANRARLQATVDQAVLAAGLDVSGASDGQMQTAAATALQRAFRNNPSVTIDGVALATVNNNIVVTVNSTTRSQFGGMFGRPAMHGTTVAAVPKRSPQKLDVEFLLDASASMGLAATSAGRDTLYAAVGCAFACHTPEGGQTKSNLQVAQELGVLTRVDVLKTAVGDMIQKLRQSQGPFDTYRVAIDTFDDTPHRAVTLTTDLASAQTYIQNYQLGGDTSFSGAMPTFNADVGSQGDGFATPKKFAIIVTDGVQGRRDRAGGFHPFDSSLCNTLKGQGVTLMVLNTRYIPMPLEPAYQQTVAPIQSRLEPALQACASPGMYFAATDQAEINDAFGRMFTAMQARLRLVR